MTLEFTGLCIGGPRDGERMVGEMKREMMFRAKVYRGEVPKDAPPSKVLGVYVHDGSDIWHWEAA